MSRKNKSTEEVLTDPERIADLARQYRERGKIDLAEIVEVATKVRVQKKGDRIIGLTIPLDGTSDAAAMRALGGTVVRVNSSKRSSPIASGSPTGLDSAASTVRSILLRYSKSPQRFTS